ncbi:MAG TPA: IS1595 family transposase [Burkholderiales bacterium]|nr:IS1595 family transposase [Burkholderiales bacterium]
MSDLTKPIFTNEDKAREHLEALRWPRGPYCPHCGEAKEVKRLEGKSHRPGLHQCSSCRGHFTVTVGTVFERSHIPLNKWLLAFHLMAASKKGISAHQLHRMLGITYKSAWFMAHRIREAMRTDFSGPIGGGGKTVEADETYWGNIKGRLPRDGRTGRGGGGEHKHKILSLVERDGTARSFHIANVDHKSLKPILQAQIAKDSHLMTDGAHHYKQIGPDFLSHESVNHTQGEYARKSRRKGVVAHTNTVESFFGLLKRGLIGTYHHVSEAHLQRYCTEFDFRFSHRTAAGYSDAQRASIALKQSEGKRLTYRRINGQEA